MFRRKRERALGVAKHVTTSQQQEDKMAQKVSSDKVFSPALMLIGVNHGRIPTFTGEQISGVTTCISRDGAYVG
jgi:hypothetical protein